MRTSRFLIGLILALLVAAAILLVPRAASAFTTAPQRMVYNGHLLDANGEAVTTAHSVRFSFWTSADYVTGDVTATGSINIGAAQYADWQEEFTVTPNSDGYFNVELGSGSALPDFSALDAGTLRSLYLQVEVKVSTAADTSYELLDRDGSDDVVDRASLLSVPFALNADLLDGRDTGTGSGNIVVLQSGGVLPVSTIPGGTQSGTFILDQDDSESANITLQFGQTLAKQLTYDIGSTYFDFNDDVNIQGDLTVDGGVTVGSHSPASGTGAGTIRWTGVDFQGFDGSSWLSLSSWGSAMEDRYVNTAGDTMTGALKVQANMSGETLRVDSNADIWGNLGVSGSITLNNVTYTYPYGDGAASGKVLTTDGSGQLSWSDVTRTVERTFQPLYAGASYQGDGSSNVGQLYVNHSGAILRNFYQWSSTRSSLQDYEIRLRVALPSSFIEWGAAPLIVDYRSTSADSADNQLDIAVYDTAGASVTLTGDSQDLVSATWASTSLTYDGAPTWTAGQDILIIFTLSAKDNEQIHLGELRLQYVERVSE